ncbi:hypothetical protein F4774DRAFT_377247 [Daldinia eschscholtzii]|nr:hypothetical protein F4774DRAFT_377247 [Daldinia eschscholtzii]
MDAKGRRLLKYIVQMRVGRGLGVGSCLVLPLALNLSHALQLVAVKLVGIPSYLRGQSHISVNHIVTTFSCGS